MKRFLSIISAALFISVFSLYTAAAEPMLIFSYVPVLECDNININEDGLSENILSANNAITTSLTDFEWQFTFKCENTATANAAFCFHINEQSNATDYKSRSKLFSVTLYGSDYSADKANFQVPHSLVVEYPNSSVGAMRPYKYKTSEKPWRTDKSSYIKLDDRSALPIDLSKPVTVNIKMNGNDITLSAWQSDDKAGQTLRELTVPMYKAAVELASGGDFKILVASGGTFDVSDMKISEYKLVKNENYKSNTQNAANGISDEHYLKIAVWCFMGVIAIIAITLVIYMILKRRHKPR